MIKFQSQRHLNRLKFIPSAYVKLYTEEEDVLMDKGYVEWTEIPNKEFIDSANSVNKIRVIWSKELSGDAKARTSVISSDNDWKNLIENSFLPRYKNGKSWEDSTAENFSLKEYSLQISSDEEKLVNKILRTAKDLQITTVYHSTLDKRLIVDGVNRALALQLKINKHEHFPEVKLMECYGSQVDEIFYCDFTHLK